MEAVHIYFFHRQSPSCGMRGLEVTFSRDFTAVTSFHMSPYPWSSSHIKVRPLRAYVDSGIKYMVRSLYNAGSNCFLMTWWQLSIYHLTIYVFLFFFRRAAYLNSPHFFLAVFMLMYKLHPHTHTHTHIYIYIYEAIKVKNHWRSISCSLSSHGWVTMALAMFHWISYWFSA